MLVGDGLHIQSPSSHFYPAKDMSTIRPQATSGELHCYDPQLRLIKHGPEQRYMSATTSQCRRLVVQAIDPVPGTNQVAISDGSGRTTKLAIRLACGHPRSGRDIIPWIVKFLWFILLLIWPFGAPRYTGFYHAYQMRYWGQLWAARSPKEYSTRDKELVGHKMPTPAGVIVTTRSITHAAHPRLLMMHGDNGWYLCDKRNVIIHQSYIAISYRQSDAFQKGTDKEGEQKKRFIDMVRATILASGYRAYWLDLDCLGESEEEKNLDVYRMADVYRGAAFTLILLRKSDNLHSIESWKSWGERMWTLPEALLGSKLCYKIGLDGPVTPISLHELTNKAYECQDEETAIVNAYSGKDPLERLERLTLLKSAIWRRRSEDDGSVYPALKVYALMGFFEHRIMPNPRETELRALARLSMANDSDRIAERMVSMLPDRIPSQACWYADADAYKSNLWEIEPEIQIAGVTRNGALVLDGCRAATIRWKNFPGVAFRTKFSFRRRFAGVLPHALWEILLFGAIIAVFSKAAGGFIIAIGLSVMASAPYLIAFANSGRILFAQPWLIGVKGVLTVEQVVTHLYGGDMSSFPRMSYTPSGSPFAIPGDGVFREGNPTQFDQAVNSRNRMDTYTLIDTLSGTLYYFQAAKPPTVCLFTGREGGMGRFVLCSESCTINELHKETVLRMPSYISRAMDLCDWVALGGVDKEELLDSRA